MAKLLDKILVIDIEATCWKDAPPPAGQANEIIEIGIVTVNVATLQREEKHSILVKPESEISAFCTQLTTLTADDLQGAGTLTDACAILKSEFLSKDRPWASWGNYDRQQFSKECAAKSVEYPFGDSHLNVKTLYSVSYGLTSERGMATALRRLGMPLDGTHHRGADDAWNIAGILCHIFGKIRLGAEIK